MIISLRKNMSKKLITVSKNTLVEEALMIMKNHHFRHLPVVNSEDLIVGLISELDLYKNLSPDEVTISQIMTKIVYTFDVKSSMKLVAEEMIKQKFSAFLITQEKEVVGIITSEDMLQLLSQLLEDKNSANSLIEDFLKTANHISLAVRNPNLLT